MSQSRRNFLIEAIASIALVTFHLGGSSNDRPNKPSGKSKYRWIIPENQSIW
jgi:hypothetical protein